MPYKKSAKTTHKTAHSSGRKYGKGSQEEVAKMMREFKKGTARSGRGHKKVTNPKQAIAIGLSKARKKGIRVPKKISSK